MSRRLINAYLAEIDRLKRVARVSVETVQITEAMKAVMREPAPIGLTLLCHRAQGARGDRGTGAGGEGRDG